MFDITEAENYNYHKIYKTTPLAADMGNAMKWFDYYIKECNSVQKSALN